MKSIQFMNTYMHDLNAIPVSRSDERFCENLITPSVDDIESM